MELDHRDRTFYQRFIFSSYEDGSRILEIFFFEIFFFEIFFTISWPFSQRSNYIFS